MYTTVITVLVFAGLILSGVYVITWGYGAVKAYRHHTTTLAGWEIVDFGALPFAAFLILAINAVNIIELGVPAATTSGLALQRIATTVLIDAIVLLRTIRWGRRYWVTPQDERTIGAVMFDRPRDGAS